MKDGDGIALSFIPCGCGGRTLCSKSGRPTAVHVEVEGDWATVVNEGFADDCGTFTARLKPRSPTEEGQIRVTGSFAGLDNCKEPLTCPIEEKYYVLRGTAGGAYVTAFAPTFNRCALDGGLGGSCAGMNLSCSSPISAACGSQSTGECAPTWSAALADKSVCVGASDPVTFTCAGYNVRSFKRRDASIVAYYDSTTGALVAVLVGDEFRTQCGGAPADFRVPSCPSSAPQPQSCP